MLVKTLDGFSYKLSTKRKSRSKISSLHRDVCELLLSQFPALTIIQELKIKVYKRTAPLYIDIYLPVFNLAIEVHGQQHYEYISHFHSEGISSFYRQQKNDQDKSNWCLANEINLLTLKYNERENWTQQIRQSIG